MAANHVYFKRRLAKLFRCCFIYCYCLYPLDPLPFYQKFTVGCLSGWLILSLLKRMMLTKLFG